MIPTKIPGSAVHRRRLCLFLALGLLACAGAVRAASGADAPFHMVDLSAHAEHNLPVERDEPGSWFGLGSGHREVLGMPFEVVDGAGIDEKRCVKKARIPARYPDATHVFALVGGVGDDSRLSVEEPNGEVRKVDLSRAVPGLKGWPVTVHWHADMVHTSVDGVRTIKVRGLYLFAVTVYTGRPKGLQQSLAAFRKKLEGVRRRRRRLQQWRELRSMLKGFSGSIAVLPDPKAPAPLDASQIADPVYQAGLARHFTVLEPEQLVDAEYFTPERFLITVYTAGETYYQTVQKPKDADSALRRYLSNGGILLSLPRGIYPFYYNEKGQGAGRAHKFGLPICGRAGKKVDGRRVRGWKDVPDHTFTFHLNPDQDIVTSLPKKVPYPAKGDRRWRPVARVVEEKARYVPILTLRDEKGRSWGQGAVWIDYTSGGSVGHAWKTLLSASKTRDVLAPALLKHAVRQAESAK